jgi:hypothetical protein
VNTVAFVVGALAVVVGLVAAGPVLGATPSDTWLEGYAAAVLERELGLPGVSPRVHDGVVTLRAEDLRGVDRARVVALLGAIRGVSRVEIEAGPPSAPPPAPVETEPPRVLEEWQVGLLPGGTLFKPLIADPRWPHFAATYQRYLGSDQATDVGAVSFGETFALLRERFRWGWWELGVQAGVFAVFDLNADSADLVNADYFVGIPFSIRRDGFSAMFRIFHQSSHLGDEFILRTRPERVNLSYESVDVKLSYEFSDWLRAYGGAGYLFHEEPASLDAWSLQYGVELVSRWPGDHSRWRPVAAVDVQHREENRWSSDFSARAGIQIDGVLASRKLQILLEYFLGRSPNGQFYKEKIEYLGLGAHFHF